jgi:hypothetical protein
MGGLPAAPAAVITISFIPMLAQQKQEIVALFQAALAPIIEGTE